MASEDQQSTQTLHTVFHEGLNLYNYVLTTQEATNGPEVQRAIQKAIELLEHATRLVSLADIFSKNETIDELATNHIQYLLLPALLGVLTGKRTSRDRKELIDVAEIYFKDFLQRTNNYQLSNYEFNESSEPVASSMGSELSQISNSISVRAGKIQKLREHEKLKEDLKNLKKNVENEHADEDIKRNYFLTMVKVFIHDTIMELESIKMERPILEHAATVQPNKNKTKFKREPLKPIIITKDAVQKAIYGAGYPSLPILTIEEFYEKRVADGIFPGPNTQKPVSLQETNPEGVLKNDPEEQEAEDLENKVEEDDEENLARMRAKDEFKDEHRRGWGNRMNRS
ncbi:unnamed protein product [Ceutorhynchus assimilis]|uniref:Immunoglobulin-binding protein 1 n=1 Tax=Ceutorhynchus assimilis TaxID=467358 RepID=A0A9N9MH23_9CUCU|nr:unnamed protein product [Ceutorhynchus assimilis]